MNILSLSLSVSGSGQTKTKYTLRLSCTLCRSRERGRKRRGSERGKENPFWCLHVTYLCVIARNARGSLFQITFTTSGEKRGSKIYKREGREGREEEERKEFISERKKSLLGFPCEISTL